MPIRIKARAMLEGMSSTVAPAPREESPRKTTSATHTQTARNNTTANTTQDRHPNSTHDYVDVDGVVDDEVVDVVADGGVDDRR